MIKKAYMQGEVEFEDGENSEEGAASPRNVGHNIYILAHQVHAQPAPPAGRSPLGREVWAALPGPLVILAAFNGGRCVLKALGLPGTHGSPTTEARSTMCPAPSLAGHVPGNPRAF